MLNNIYTVKTDSKNERVNSKEQYGDKSVSVKNGDTVINIDIRSWCILFFILKRSNKRILVKDNTIRDNTPLTNELDKANLR